MEDLDARIAALLTRPTGCAFLLITEASGLTPEIAAQPAVSMHIAACAVDEVRPWRTDHDAVVAKILERGAKQRDLARAVLASPQTGWWFGPLDRTQQLWLSRDGNSPDSGRLNLPPTGPPTPWERYAQKPAQGLYTSMLVDGTSSLLAALAQGVGDLAAAFQVQPLACWRLEASPAARVFEVDGPQAWHELCVRYPTRTEDGLRKRLLERVRLFHRYPAGEDGRLVPDWSAVAQDWDAVHLTLGGLLTAEQVRIESSAGWTQLDGWDCEQTVWLRWCFTSAVRLPDVEPSSLSLSDLSSLTWTL